MTMPILPGTDGVRKMSKSLGNYVGVTEPAAEIFGKLMSVPDDAMPLYWELLLGEELDEARHPNEAKRDFARRICDRFAGSGSGAEAEARFNQHPPATARSPPTSPIHRIAIGGDVHLPVLLREAFGVSGSEARRLIAQGGGPDRRRAGSGPIASTCPSAELAGHVIQLGKRRFAQDRDRLIAIRPRAGWTAEPSRSL